MDKNAIISSTTQRENAAKEVARSPKEVCERIVVFLDIMGFKDLVARQAETKINEKLHELSTFIYSQVAPDSFVQFSIFSDSIILFSNELTVESFKYMINLTGNIVEKSIELGLPIRGAVAAGLCTVTNEKVPYYFGQPIVDAYALEENLVLYGVVLHNTVEMFANYFCENKDLVFDYKVMLKGGASKHYVVNWFGRNYESNMEKLKAIRATVSDSPRRYIDATIDCFEAWEKM